jgi:DNA ligase (NAD+)
MLSLSHTYDLGEVSRFVEGKGAGLGVVVELKYDGVAVSVRSDGRCVTRGDGIEGTDVTALLERALPGPLPRVPQGEVRGEVVARVGDLLPGFANTRSMVSGYLNSLGPQADPPRLLFRAYQWVGYDRLAPDAPATHLAALDRLDALGFTTDRARSLCAGAEEAVEAVQARSSVEDGIAADGVVVKVNDLAACEALASTSSAPRWALAWKFPPAEAETSVVDVVMQVSRTGRATPVAVLSPVTLDGTVVTRASLHNMLRLHELGLVRGSRVQVRKAGSVIPQITRVVGAGPAEPAARDAFCKELVSTCPCDLRQPLTPDGDDPPPEPAPAFPAFWGCRSPLCRFPLLAQLRHLTSKPALDLESLGPKTLAELVEAGAITDLASVLELDEPTLARALAGRSGWGPKRIANIIAGLQESKARATEPRLLYALGLPGVGADTAEALIAGLGSLQGLLSSTPEQIRALHGIGEKTAQSITQNLLENPTTKAQLERMTRQTRIKGE